MKSNKIGAWSDNLRHDEIKFSQECAKKLQGTKIWKDFLDRKRIKEALKIEPDPDSTYGDCNNKKSDFFEISIILSPSFAEINSPLAFKSFSAFHCCGL